MHTFICANADSHLPMNFGFAILREYYIICFKSEFNMSGKTEHKEEAELKVEDKHSLVFFICAWLGVGCNILNIDTDIVNSLLVNPKLLVLLYNFLQL